MTRADFSGLWRLNTDKSRMHGAISAMSMKIEHNDPDFVQTLKTKHEDGRLSLGCFSGNTSGATFFNTIQGMKAQSTARWIGDELLIESFIEAGERHLHLRDHWSISENGKELRMEHRDDGLAGQLVVLERAG